MNHREYDSALVSFQQAERIIPGFLADSLARQDMFRIHTKTGIIFYLQALKLWKNKGNSRRIINLYKQAGKRFNRAIEIDPKAYIPAYRLASTYAALEFIYTSLFPDRPSPYKAGPMYQEAIKLRPNGLDVHKSYARYLYHKKDFMRLKQIVLDLIRIYPAYYYRLKKEKFFSPELMPELEKGLLQAVEQKISLLNAHAYLSSFYNETKAYDKAVEHYKQHINLKSHANTSGNYIHMGWLYLRAGAPEKSSLWFNKAISKSKDFDSTIRRIHSMYKRESSQDIFLEFTAELEEKKRFSSSLHFEIAKALMDKKEYPSAKARLYNINSRAPNAQACYLLARIAQAEKNWDQMEIYSQKASRLAPKNSTYFHMCAQALQRQRKYVSAEKMADKALEHTQKNPWLFNHRAWLRWAQKKYLPAASDWKQAFKLQPDNSAFPYYISLAYEQKAMFQEALSYIQQALALKPDDKKYQTLYERLQ